MPDASFTRGLVLEDQPDTRQWLGKSLCEAFGEIDVFSFGSLEPAFHWLKGERGDGEGLVCLIDLVLPDGSGVDVIKHLADTLPKASPIVVSIYDDDAHLFDAIAAGAQGYLLKDERPETLIRHLREIQSGEPPLSPSVARRILAYFQKRTPAAVTEGRGDILLTNREREVLALLGRGLRLNSAAEQLGLTRHTVAGYVKVIYSKLNISSRAEAALEAMKRGLI